VEHGVYHSLLTLDKGIEQMSKYTVVTDRKGKITLREKIITETILDWHLPLELSTMSILAMPGGTAWMAWERRSGEARKPGPFEGMTGAAFDTMGAAERGSLRAERERELVADSNRVRAVANLPHTDTHKLVERVTHWRAGERLECHAVSVEPGRAVSVHQPGAMPRGIAWLASRERAIERGEYRHTLTQGNVRWFETERVKPSAPAGKIENRRQGKSLLSKTMKVNAAA
jgi:hypothetical protein